jgi:hypothetical protein
MHNALPEFVATFGVNRFVSDNGEFMNTRRDKNEHTVALARLVHTESIESFARRNERIAIQLSTLN